MNEQSGKHTQVPPATVAGGADGGFLTSLSDPLLQQLSERIECRTGLHFPPARFADLRRGLAQAGLESGQQDPLAYAEALLARDLSHADLAVLAGWLTIGETHFFRDAGAFEYLETKLLPEIIAAKRGGERRLRIWSAGCATGEEPYSIAMLLHRLLPDLKDWELSLLGTDINPKVLSRAAAGVYTEWSFRGTPAWVKPRYFVVRGDGRYEIQPWLKRMVSFTCLNLAEDSYPFILNHTHGLDLVICRNVLLYFAPSRIPQVIQRFHRSLVEGGHLVMGSVEACQIEFPAFTAIAAPGMALYRKHGGTLDRNTSGLPVREDGASSLAVNQTTGWKPVVHDRQDAYPPPKLAALAGVMAAEPGEKGPAHE